MVCFALFMLRPKLRCWFVIEVCCALFRQTCGLCECGRYSRNFVSKECESHVDCVDGAFLALNKFGQETLGGKQL